ncbi:SMI1/KNR4 family protein [Methylobacterium sp. NEAU K]|uniref:SMI1/KNR4 family protein n=1 Tax=Methylobacterium sp. NEAU K TaxID=3064946 RepID=UPI0027356278|nr:SMI1/KNR4 family protein [Methylobacterium sp. NEAU K]MDP4003094.1 SMI1/KNR4 family protein [Methylobacterium sp. NEAU K]
MWERVFENLSPGFTAGPAALDQAAAELGFPLPASYRSFCETCGIGVAGAQFRVAVPAPFEPCDLATQAGIIAYSVGSAVQKLEDGAEPHHFEVEGGDPAMIERGCFFGAGEDGSFLFWDVSGTGEEYDVWLLAPDLETIRFGGESLADFFGRVTGPGAALVLGPGMEPLPASFEGISEATLARGGCVA